jgi:hypothetical protein
MTSDAPTDAPPPRRTVRALVIDPGEPGTVRDVPADLEGLRAAIGGGYLEAVSGLTWHAYIDEDGVAKQLPHNETASALASLLSPQSGATYRLAGPAVFLTGTPDGEEADVPGELLQLHSWMLDPGEAEMPAAVREWLRLTRRQFAFTDDAPALTETDDPTGRRYRRIAVEILRALALHGHGIERGAIVAARVGMQVYRHFGYHADPLPVAVTLMSQQFIATDGVQGHSIGVLGTGSTVRGGWDGHLALVIDTHLIDLTAQQFARPAQDIVVNGPAILDIPAGVPLAVGTQFNHQRADGGTTSYRITDDDTWKHSRQWHSEVPGLELVVSEAIARAAQYPVERHPDAGESVACKVCRIPLGKLMLPDGTVAYQHARPWEDHGHEAIPEFGVAPAQVAARCDFCDEDGVAWIYTGPALSITINPFTGLPPGPGEPTGERSEGVRWCGCDICDRHIRAKDLEGLWDAHRKTAKHRQRYARYAKTDPALYAANRARIVDRWRQYVPYITRRVPVDPPELAALNPRALPKIRDRLVQAMRSEGMTMVGADPAGGVILPGPDLDVHDCLSVEVSHVSPQTGDRFAARIADSLEQAELYYVSADFTALALASARELPDVSLRPEEMPSPHGLVVWEDPIMSLPTEGEAADEAVMVAASWSAVTDLGVWVLLYVRTEQFLAGRPEARERFGVLLPYSTGGGFDFASQHVAADLPSRAQQVAEATFRTLLATWFLVMQPGVADVDIQPTNDKRLLKQAKHARVEPPAVRVVTLRRAKQSRRAGDQEPGRTVSVRFVVRGHWKRQAYGTGRSKRKTIYVAPFMKGPEGAPLKLGGDQVPVVKVLR